MSKALFPIGELTKPEVRELASQLDLVTADKRDSQGLCFIGKVKLPCFVKPNNAGSSFGVSKVKEPAELQRAIDKALTEDRIRQLLIAEGGEIAKRFA